MPYPELTVSTSSARDGDADAIVLVLPPLDEASAVLADWPGVEEALRGVGFTGAVGTTTRVFAPASTDVPLFVVGTGAAPSPDAVRDAVGAAVRTTTGHTRLAVAIPYAEGHWRAAAEGAVLGGYRFAGYKSSDAAKSRASQVVLHLDAEVADAELHAVDVVGSAVALVKDLVNIPAEWLGPADLAERAIEAVAGLPVDVEVLDEAELEAQGYGGILGVGKGSDRPPRLVRLSYAPGNAARHIALVGKGITFDTGGLSLKPPASMVGMKFDMAGAATALAVVRAAAQQELPVAVTAWMCIADNMPSGRATRPGDVLRMLDGQTVEVLNTDAEGRLVMADGLVAASRTHPDVIVDIATLTGAVIVALGNRHTGVMGDDATVARYLEAAASVGEAAWQLPLPDHMEDELDSPIADLRNAKVGDPAGGTMFAGLFLRRFVGRAGEDADAPRIPWVHLDIAGSGENKAAPFGPTDKGPTAATVRSLLAFLEAETR
ncbi:leucyl aminopeptidase [Microbacterium sp. NPDC079995]|uniref:leucyl aminopeptidase n=1 Tax=unclassified Microbacterium TaxID=2609290 RepID=UPI00344B53CA